MKPVCVVSCPIDTFSGYGHRSRDFVRSLIDAKGGEWDIKILPQKWGDTPWGYLDDNDPLKSRFIYGLDKQPEIWFQITIPNEFQKVGKYNIGLTAGIETTICPFDDWGCSRIIIIERVLTGFEASSDTDLILAE